MSYSSTRPSGTTQQIDWGQPGYKRKKFAEYLKAANDLRQSYFSVEGGDGTNERSADGVFPDGAIIRRGDEEMLLFPSYARKHVKTQHAPAQPGESEEDYWKREWTKHESDKAVVDVDVRGWLYTPHRGPPTRKHRLVLGLARQMSGLPSLSPSGSTTALNKMDNSRSSSPVRHRIEDEELIAQEATRLVRQGEVEKRNAQLGKFSEQPTSSSPSRVEGNESKVLPEHRRALTNSSRTSTASSEEDISIAPIQKRSSWPLDGKFTQAEIVAANERLSERLKPFMSTPLVNTPVSAFFYNDTASRQHTVYTDASGHFTLRASLDFVPTHVRVFAGEKLSATEPVIVTAHHGVSLISDVDDTIKHSAISAGAREIFRNVFVRDLGDLTIEGVREWYTSLFEKGVQLHYVSNSPWQLYPLLTAFFKMARLPPGSFHLKQYSGLFQGIFEPVAERKKSSLDKIMRDFPDRKFILVGDSGEADLEVYTETALDNPGRILAIFIRDVTTPIKSAFFESTSAPSGVRGYHTRHGSSDGGSPRLRPRKGRSYDEDADLQAAIAASLADMEGTGRKTQTQNTASTRQTQFPRTPATFTTSPEEEDLIDFGEALPQPSQGLAHPVESHTRLSPAPPPKPQALRSASPLSAQDVSSKPPPPLPRKASSAVQSANASRGQDRPMSTMSTRTLRPTVDKEAPALPARPQGYREMAKEKLISAYNAYNTYSAVQPATPNSKSSAPALPPRRNLSSFSLNNPRNLPSRSSTGTSTPTTINPRREYNSDTNTFDEDPLSTSPGENVMSKREYLWRQRWARAKALLEPKGVYLQTWRVGDDAAAKSMRLVDDALAEIEKEQKNKK